MQSHPHENIPYVPASLVSLHPTQVHKIGRGEDHSQVSSKERKRLLETISPPTSSERAFVSYWWE